MAQDALSFLRGGLQSDNEEPSQTTNKVDAQDFLTSFAPTGENPKISPETYSPTLAIMDSFGEGVADGFAGLLGLPVDMVNLGLGYLGLGTSTPFGGSKSLDINPILDDIAAKIGITGAEKKGTASERIAKRIGVEVGANIVPVGAGLRAAGKAPTLISASEGSMRQMFRPIVETFARAPAGSTAAEFGLATTAGLGAGIAQESSDNPLAEFAGQMVGVATPPALLGAARAGGQAFRGLTAGVSAKQSAKEALRSHITQGGKQALARIEARPAGDNFGTTAQVTNDPGLLTLERSISRSGGATTGRFFEKRTTQNQALRRQMGLLEGGSDDLLRTQDAKARKAIQNTIDDTLGRLDRKIDEAMPGDTTPSSADLSAISSQAKDGLMEELSKARSTESELWQRVGSDLKVDFTPLKNMVRSIIDGMGKLPDEQNIPRVARDIIKTKKAADQKSIIDFVDDEEPFSELINIRKRIINERMIEKGQQAPNGTKINFLNQLDNAIMDTINTLDDSFLVDVVDFNTAREFSNQLNSRFTRGMVNKVLSKNIQGGARTPASASLRTLTGGTGSREAAQEFIAAAGGNQGLVDLGTDFIVKDFLNKNMSADNVLNAKRARLWVSNHTDVLDEFPAAKQAIARVIQRHSRAETLINRRTRTQRFIEKSAAHEYLGKSPERGIDMILASNDPAQSAKRIMRFMRDDPSAVEGFKRHLWEGIARRMELAEKDLMQEAFLSPAKFQKSLQKYNTLFKSVYGEAQYKNLQDVFGKLEMMAKSQRPVLTGGSDTSQNLGISIPQVLGRAYNVKRGVVSKTFVIMEGASRVINRVLHGHTQEQSRRLLEEALIDPDIGKLLITKVTPQNEVQIAKRLRGHLLSIARDDNSELQD